MALRIKRAARAARPVDLDYLADIGRRVHGGLIACRMDMIGASGNQPRKPYQVAERIAIIDICGVLCNDACWWDETDYCEIQDEIDMAANDGDVDGILMCINSPGGETDNAFETGLMIEEAAKVKPIWSVAAPMAYSAAYLLASKGAKVYVPAITGGVGSIGVYALHLDYSGYLAKAGIVPTLISAGAGKTDGNPYEPLSPEAKVKIVSEIQRLYGEFVSQVATGRKMAESAIIKLGANLFDGAKAAIGAGLADRAGNVESAWLDLATNVAQAKRGISASAEGKGDNTRMETPNPAPAAATPATPAAAAATPAAVNTDELRREAEASGFAHATQILELCELAGKPERAASFIREKKSVADVREALLKERAEASDKNPTRSGVLPADAADTAKPTKSCKELMQERLKREGVL